MYRKHPAVWKVKSAEYSNSVERNRSWDALQKFCNEKFPSVDREWVKKKVRTIKGTFNKELKKVKAGEKKSGNGEEHTYKPKLWYYDLLLFLTDNVATRESFRNVDCEDGTDGDKSQSTAAEEENGSSVTTDKGFVAARRESTSSDTSSNQQLSWPRGERVGSVLKKRKTTGRNKRRALEEEADAVRSCPHDEFAALGTVFGNELRALAKYDYSQFVHAKKLCHDVIYHGFQNELSRKSTVVNENIDHTNHLQHHPSYFHQSVPPSFLSHSPPTGYSRGTGSHNVRGYDSGSSSTSISPSPECDTRLDEKSNLISKI
ncbi:hypothetical protein GE061_005804 [Apolygus lucorum]|uniref:MADF domain-containing protein n=1 Tax=Apolygus lucorum TaxID=248454 RepID=A0A8S9WZX6_APOLU|nr:hypothetical protein GE061_005804 [Apolygus lucorum]